MDKRILKKIAKDWSKSILASTDLSNFDKTADELLSLEEKQYIVNEVVNIANKISKNDVAGSFENILKRYYTID